MGNSSLIAAYTAPSALSCLELTHAHPNATNPRPTSPSAVIGNNVPAVPMCLATPSLFDN